MRSSIARRVRLDRGERAARELEHARPQLLRRADAHALCRTSWTTTSTDADGRPGQPLDLVGDLRAHRRRDLGEVEAVLDDDVQPDLHRLRVAADGDAVAAQELPEPRARREPDDAVAARGRLGDDLGDDVARDA